MFTSNDAHYSIKKLAAFEGLGSDNVYLVKTDELGKMDPTDLEIQIQKSLSEKAVPFMVSATAGKSLEYSQTVHLSARNSENCHSRYDCVGCF